PHNDHCCPDNNRSNHDNHLCSFINYDQYPNHYRFLDNNPSSTTKTNTFPMTTASPATAQPSTTTTARQTLPFVVRTTNISASEAIAVKCNLGSITVTVARDFLQSSYITEAALHLGMAECGVNGGNATHAQLTVAWDECNSLLKHVVSHAVSLSSCVIGIVTLQLMNGMVHLPHNFSLSPSESVMVVVSLNTSEDKIKVVIDKCWATPTAKPSCSINPFTTVITNGNSSSSSLSVKIFSFVDLNIIYLHCQVEICVEMDSASCTPVSHRPSQ
uniref:ZP domain-containing protein n=1 Tax=Neogobius melanostomus TaxID=47308 RepID=A0A8C6TP40_9GOBI